jgi:hypothetical protein
MFSGSKNCPCSTSQLEYKKYIVQGDDLGSIISHFLAGNLSRNVVNVHSDFWLAPPNATDIERYKTGQTKDKNIINSNLLGFSHSLIGFTHIQAMPLEAVIALTDNPVGYDMWIYPLLHYGIDKYEWSVEEIITWPMMYFIQ